jgi:hypothetical protein
MDPLDNCQFPCNKFISTGGLMGLPTQGDEKRLGPATTLYATIALSFVIPSEAEGSAVPRTFTGNVFRQSAAEWRDLRFLLGSHAPSFSPGVRSLSRFPRNHSFFAACFNRARYSIKKQSA